MPAAGALRFIAPTPLDAALLTTGSINVKLDASCSFHPDTLAVSLNGTTIPASGFLPFSACTANRITSQTVNVPITLPNGTISSAPSSLTAGDTGNFSGSGDGDGLSWSFDGGAPPATGSPVNATFDPAGSFTVLLRATAGQQLAASGMNGGNLVVALRDFNAGDSTPDTRVVAVEMPPDVDFTNFESGQVHPLALSAAGDELYAINTPEGRLSIFDVEANGSLTFSGDVPVGVDPVSLAVRPGTSEVWVVNHLSDTVSIVDAAGQRLIETLVVPDEPTDIVFASGRAFVSLAGNQDRVNVYNASTRALVTSLSIFGDDPRALTTNAAGTEVYLVVLESGNQTTALFTALVEDGGGLPPPSPPRDSGLGTAHSVGLIVKFNPANSQWQDETGDNWASFIDYTLPDNDLIVIDADATTPSIIRNIPRVGTILFDAVLRPGTSPAEVWVPNTDARNLVRFEPNLRGHLVTTRVSKVNTSVTNGVTFSDLNSHISYSSTPGPPSEIAQSLAIPGDGVFNATGTTYYQTAFGSRKVGVLNSSGAVTALIDVGEGPSGVALNESDSRLYVLNRFSNTLSTVDTTTNTEIDISGIAGPSQFDPSPDVIKTGRKFLYDAQLTSGHGDTACATCHVFSNFDNIAWDLGDPQGQFVDYDDAPWVSFTLSEPSTPGFDPMKGPMTTQTLRGLEDMEPFHWRGDRQNFQHFNHAFVGLMGMDGFCSVSLASCEENTDCPTGETCLGLSPTDMDDYTDFINTVKLPPNPFRNLNNTMPNSIAVPTGTGNPIAGQNGFTNNLFDAGAISCNGCHLLPTGTTNGLFNGQLEGETQDFKIPHLRNMYEKVGFDVIRPGLQGGDGNNVAATAQKKGFGFIHDGAVSLFEFLNASVFQMTTQQRLDVFAFMLAFPTETRPCVGHQETITNANKNDAPTAARIDTMVAQAEAGSCDVIAKGVLGAVAKGYVYDEASNLMTPDTFAEAPVSEDALRTSVTGADVVTFTGVPNGAGVRLGIDRDRDTFLDRVETTDGHDPADPHSNPWQN